MHVRVLLHELRRPLQQTFSGCSWHTNHQVVRRRGRLQRYGYGVAGTKSRRSFQLLFTKIQSQNGAVTGRSNGELYIINELVNGLWRTYSVSYF